MRCPYCGKEMELGRVESRNELSWKEGTKRGWRMDKVSPNSVVLSKFSFFTKDPAVRAFLCRSCEKIIIDYSVPQCDLNYNQTLF